MPRSKKVIRDQQIYKLPFGATVTIDYDVEHMPPFFQPGPGVVIVGEHQCQPMVLHDSSAYGAPTFAGVPENAVPRGGNFGFDENDPNYNNFKTQLAGGGGMAPAPPGISPKVLTSGDIMGLPQETLAALVNAETPVEAEGN